MEGVWRQNNARSASGGHRQPTAALGKWTFSNCSDHIGTKNLRNVRMKYSFMNDNHCIFTETTGFPPYEYQKKMIDKILSGKNIVLQAPTGAGKTWAAILPFIIAKRTKQPFPDKLIYSLPLRTLVNSLSDSLIKDHSNFFRAPTPNEIKTGRRTKTDDRLIVTVQTGERPDDPYFLLGDIIFTTIDQSLSSILSIPFSLSKRQANINAGAILSSYLVFDEFHLFDIERAFSTAFHILKNIRGISPFCLMTATLSEPLLNELCRGLSAEPLGITVSELEKIKSQAQKERVIYVSPRELTAEHILNHRKSNERTIVLCNTVDRCIDLYTDLEKELKNLKDKPELICIHSRFFDEDRKDKETRIRTIFEKNSRANAILVSTQIVEVGLDISCDTMHTEISPINSFLQRIGRCARYENEKGIVFVYPIKKSEIKNDVCYLPYDKHLCETTLEELGRINGRNLDYWTSQQLIDKILGPEERSQIAGIQASTRFSGEIQDCWRTPDKGTYARQLIRKIDSVNILIHDRPERIKNPYKYHTISMFRYSLQSKLRKIESDIGCDWLIKRITENNMIEDETDEFKYETCSSEDIQNEPLVILNKKYISYSHERGLNFIGLGSEQSTEINMPDENAEFYRTSKDTYADHVRYMIKAYDDLFKEQYGRTFDKIISKKGNLPFDELIRFIFIMHDFGKLNKEWQIKAREYQSKKEKQIVLELLAHTDQEQMDRKIKLPPHASIGAVASWAISEKALNDYLKADSDLVKSILKAIFSCILKHHSVETHSFQEYDIVDGGKKEVVRLIHENLHAFGSIDESSPFLTRCNDSLDLSDSVVDFNKDVERYLYFLFVRILRLCDQQAFKYK